MLLSNSLVYDHRMECGSDDVAMAALHLSNWSSIKNVSSMASLTLYLCMVFLLDTV